MTHVHTQTHSRRPAYLTDLHRIRATGGATAELSYHTPLNNLLTAVGATLKPKVRCVSELADLGAGRPDLGLYAARQMQRGKRREGQLPECGVVDVKPVGDDAWLTAGSAQVSRYWSRYRLVLVTNTRVYVLDPCCGTGAYLAEVLRRIASNLQDRGLGALTGAEVKRAATDRVLDRPLNEDEVLHFTNTARRITAILQLVAQDNVKWQPC